MMPDTHRDFHNLKVGHAYYAGEAHRAERNARVDALLNFYGLVDDKVCWTPPGSRTNDYALT